jgi:hypothetical protein
MRAEESDEARGGDRGHANVGEREGCKGSKRRRLNFREPARFK